MSERPRLLILITLAETGGAQTSVSLLLPGLTGEFDVTVAAHGSGPVRDAARQPPACPHISDLSPNGIEEHAD